EDGGFEQDRLRSRTCKFSGVREPMTKPGNVPADVGGFVEGDDVAEDLLARAPSDRQCSHDISRQTGEQSSATLCEIRRDDRPPEFEYLVVGELVHSSVEPYGCCVSVCARDLPWPCLHNVGLCCAGRAKQALRQNQPQVRHRLGFGASSMAGA